MPTRFRDERVTRRGRRRRRASVRAACLLALAAFASGCSADASLADPPASSRVATVTVSPAAATVVVGGSLTLQATLADERGNPVSGRTVAWTSTAPSVATVSSGGVVTGVAPGTATIAAAADGRTGTAIVTVNGAGSTSGEFQTGVPPIDFNVLAARPTTTSVSLSVYSATGRTITLSFADGSRSTTHALRAGEPELIEVTGLLADRSYRYRIDAPALSFSGQFRTARSRGATYRVAMQADSHLDANSDTAIYANTLANIAGDSADFLVDLGDTFMSDKYPDYRDAAAQYYAQRHYFGIPGRVMPLFLVQGNHDGELGWLPANAAWAAAQRMRWFPPVLANGFYGSGTGASARNYYAWSWGSATFIVLDPYAATTTQPARAGTSWAWTLGREQYDWLAATLRATTTPYTFVFLHHLVGGKGYEARGGAEASALFEWGGKNLDGTPGFATQRPGWGLPIHDLLVQHGVSAVFHGHDHLYVHQVRDGVHYQEVPQPSFARENAINSAADYGYLSGTLLGSSGHLRITVTDARATVEYVRSRIGLGNASIADRYDITPSPRP